MVALLGKPDELRLDFTEKNDYRAMVGVSLAYRKSLVEHRHELHLLGGFVDARNRPNMVEVATFLRCQVGGSGKVSPKPGKYMRKVIGWIGEPAPRVMVYSKIIPADTIEAATTER